MVGAEQEEKVPWCLEYNEADKAPCSERDEQADKAPSCSEHGKQAKKKATYTELEKEAVWLREQEKEAARLPEQGAGEEGDVHGVGSWLF